MAEACYTFCVKRFLKGIFPMKHLKLTLATLLLGASFAVAGDGSNDAVEAKTDAPMADPANAPVTEAHKTAHGKKHTGKTKAAMMEECKKRVEEAKKMAGEIADAKNKIVADTVVSNMENVSAAMDKLEDGDHAQMAALEMMCNWGFKKVTSMHKADAKHQEQAKKKAERDAKKAEKEKMKEEKKAEKEAKKSEKDEKKEEKKEEKK